MVKKLKGGNYTNSNTLSANVSPSVNSTSVNSVNSNGVSSTTKYIIVGCLILLLVIIIGLGVYFYKKHNAKPTYAPTFAPTTMPTIAPTNLGSYHPSKLLDDNKNNKVVAIINGQLKDFGHSYKKLEKEEKRKFKRCFKNPLNTNCSF